MDSFSSPMMNSSNNDYVVLQEASCLELNNFEMMFNHSSHHSSHPQMNDHQTTIPHHLSYPNTCFQPQSYDSNTQQQQILNQYMMAVLQQQLQSQQHTCANNYYDSNQASTFIDPTSLFNNAMLRLDSEEIFLHEEDVTVMTNNSQHNNNGLIHFDDQLEYLLIENGKLVSQTQSSVMTHNQKYIENNTNESNTIGTPTDLKEEDFLTSLMPDLYNVDVTSTDVAKVEVCPSPMSQFSSSTSQTSANNSSTISVNISPNAPSMKLIENNSLSNSKDSAISSWLNSVAILSENRIILKCDPYGFTENNGTCRPRGSAFSVFVNDSIHVDISLNISSIDDLCFEQDGVSKSISELFIEECKLELCSYVDDDDSNLTVVVESSEPMLTHVKKVDSTIQASINSIIKRDTNNKRASRSKTKTTSEEKKGRRKKKNEACASKKVCFLRIVVSDTGYILASSDNIWVRSKTRQEMERKKDRALAQKRKKEESKPTETSTKEEKSESPKKKKKTSKSKKSKSKEQTVNSFTYEQSPMRGSANSASYGVVFNLDSM